MIKKRIVPEHEEFYKVCDFCKEEIIDYTYVSYENNKEHYHSMYAGGTKGVVKKNCLDKQREIWSKRLERDSND